VIRGLLTDRLASGGLPVGLSLLYSGSRYRCPICERGFRRLMYSNGRDLAVCPGCGSRERHRHLWLYLQRETDFFRRPARVLHIAPEPSLLERLSPLPHLDYVAGDLDPPPGLRRIDVTQMEFPDGHFDWILCFHVLEHVPDDRSAMGELHRVLRRGGTAIVQVPVMREITDEDPEVTDPQERLRRFGQADHVRVYGRDFYDRLAAAGFRVEARLFRHEIPAEDRERLGLNYHFPPGRSEPGDAFWELPLCTK
jgi:SAM-dependent methyltransferase